jgi:cytochrome P450
MTLLLAGHETTAVSLSWTWLLLSQHPEVERKLWDELCAVLNGRSPTLRDLASLPYTERVVKEAMRLYPPVWATVRTAVKPCTLGGYLIPAKSPVLMSQWVMHRDPRFFDQPEQFNPDRWLDERGKSLPRFAYFPFGGGPRICIGASFAFTEALPAPRLTRREHRHHSIHHATAPQRHPCYTHPPHPLTTDHQPLATISPPTSASTGAH